MARRQGWISSGVTAVLGPDRVEDKDAEQDQHNILLCFHPMVTFACERHRWTPIRPARFAKATTWIARWGESAAACVAIVAGESNLRHYARPISGSCTNLELNQSLRCCWS